mmetsp:Transcript_16072/g.54797  ORF Transcript_16072/g.54797 Transcript_16072/m.54797 type:complete len:275 (-) Transcript_16072:656-1480(-)
MKYLLTTVAACPSLGLGPTPVVLTVVHVWRSISRTCRSPSTPAPSKPPNTHSLRPSSDAEMVWPRRGDGAPPSVVTATHCIVSNLRWYTSLASPVVPTPVCPPKTTISSRTAHAAWPSRDGIVPFTCGVFHFIVSVLRKCRSLSSACRRPPNTTSLFLPIAVALCPDRPGSCFAVPDTRSHTHLSMFATQRSRPSPSPRAVPPYSTRSFVPMLATMWFREFSSRSSGTSPPNLCLLRLSSHGSPNRMDSLVVPLALSTKSPFSFLASASRSSIA